MTDATAVLGAVPQQPADARAEAFHALYAAEFPGIARYAYQLTRDVDTAAELTQEAFARLYARWSRVQNPVPYLFRTVTNLVRNAWRSEQYTARSLDTEGRAVAVEVPAVDLGVRDAVARLHRRYRVVVLLYYYADLPLPDVATAVRRPEGTVKRLLSEARAHLARTLGDPDA